MIFRILKKRICGQKGITLTEVIVSIAIFSFIMGAAGRYIIFSLNSWRSIQTTTYAISRTNNFVSVIEKEVRQAKMPTYQQNAVGVFAGLERTEPAEEGNRVDIYTDYHGEMVRITYLVYNDALYRIEEKTNSSADPPISPDVLAGMIPVIPVVRSLKDSDGAIIPIFKVDNGGIQLMIRFEVVNANGQDENLFEVNTSFTVRRQEVS